MAKKSLLKESVFNSLKVLTMIGLVVFLFAIIGFSVYLGITKQTIFGVPSEVKVGDIVKFHAIAQVGGRSGITCYAEPFIIKGNSPDCELCTRVSLGKKELKDGCVGLPCNLNDQWSYTPTEARSVMGLDVKYTCFGVTAPPNDKLTFSVKEAITPQVTCSDSDNGQDTKVRGYTKLSTDSFGKEDFCNSETELVEFYCSNNQVLSKSITCTNGCSKGICLVTPPTDGGSGTTGGTQCTSPQYLSKTTNTCVTCDVGFKASLCKDNNRYFIYREWDDKLGLCVDANKLESLCSSDEKCNDNTNQKGCVPDVKEGTTRNKKCVKEGVYDSVEYQTFLDGVWKDTTELCIGDQFCNPETLECELNEDAPKVKTEETEKAKKEAKEFDFIEFFKTYGIAIGVMAFLLVVAVVFIIVTIKRKK